MGVGTPNRVRRRVVYSGRVQGVGFRYTTASISRRYAVVGYVKNLQNGNVEVVAEAPPECLRDFLDAIAHAFDGFITDSIVENEESNEVFERFDIRY